MTLRLLIATALLAVGANADVLYNMPSSASDVGNGQVYSVEGSVDFFLTGCINGTGCTLNIEIANTYSTTENFHQAISGLTFTLTNASTTLTFSGASLTNSVSTTGGGAVSTIKDTSGTADTPTNSPGSWAIEATPTPIGTAGKGWGTTGSVGTLALEAGISNNSVTNEIVDGNAHGTSFNGHFDEYTGPVYFQITGISGLTTSTDVSNVSLLFGQSNATAFPDGHYTLPTADCSSTDGSGVCSTGQIGYLVPLPEPASFLITGSGLMALFFLLRRFRTANLSQAL